MWMIATILAQSSNGVTEAAEVMGQVLGARLEAVIGLVAVLLAVFAVVCLILGFYALRSQNRYLSIHEKTVDKVGGLSDRIEKLEDETTKLDTNLAALAAIAHETVIAMQTVTASLVDARKADVERTASNNRNYTEILKTSQIVTPLPGMVTEQTKAVDALRQKTEEGFETMEIRQQALEGTLTQMNRRLDDLIELFKADQVSRNVAVLQTNELKAMVTAMLEEIHKAGTGPLPPLPDNKPLDVNIVGTPGNPPVEPTKET